MDDSEYSGAMAPIYATAATELIRLLMESTSNAYGLHDTRDASDVLRNVEHLLQDLHCTLRQVGLWFDREAAQGLVLAVGGPYDGHPGEAVGVLSAYISAVCGVLEQAASGLSATAIIAGTLSRADADQPCPVSTHVDATAPGSRVEASILQFPSTGSRTASSPA